MISEIHQLLTELWCCFYCHKFLVNNVVSTNAVCWRCWYLFSY